MRKTMLLVLGVSALTVAGGLTSLSERPKCVPPGGEDESGFMSVWTTAYPDSTLPDRMTAQTGSRCNVCHHPPSRGTQGTCYKDDIRALLDQGMSIGQAIAALDGEDSDGDGVSNGEEITTQRTDDPTQVGYHAGLVGGTGTDPCGADPNQSVTGVLETPPAASEKICPDDPADWSVEGNVGGATFGNALDTCTSDNVYLGQIQNARIFPFLPECRVNVWAHTQFAPGSVASLEIEVEGKVNANIGGAHPPGTWRTELQNQTNGTWLLIDSRGGPNAFTDITWTAIVDVNPGDYVNAADGEIRIRSAGFKPGVVFSPNWGVQLDLFSVTVNQ